MFTNINQEQGVGTGIVEVHDEIIFLCADIAIWRIVSENLKVLSVKYCREKHFD